MQFISFCSILFFKKNQEGFLTVKNFYTYHNWKICVYFNLNYIDFISIRK